MNYFFIPSWCPDVRLAWRSFSLFTCLLRKGIKFLLNNFSCCDFPGNSNLVYAIIRKRNVFHQLANLPTDLQSIQKALQRKKKAPEPISRTNSQEGVSMEGSRPAAPAEPGTLKTSLVATPGQFNLFVGEGLKCHYFGSWIGSTFGACFE